MNKFIDKFIITFVQSSSCVNKATPRFIQCLSSNYVGNLIYITKLVECPVVLRTPLLAEVLYTGHL
jgi:hypothetical protein